MLDMQGRVAVARGDQPADILLTNLQLVNLHTGEIYPSEIAIADGLIVGVGAGYQAHETLDLGGRYVAPALIDAHVHIESSLCTPPQFAQALLRGGVATAVTDPHEIANVLGLEGIRYMLTMAEQTPLNIYIMASSCVPATPMGTAGSSLSAQDLADLLSHPRVLGLAEMMNYPGVVYGDPEALAKLALYAEKVLDGHCPALTGQALNAYRVTGITSDHECTSVEEAREKLRVGLTLFIREATNAHNLEALLPVITPQNARRICFCTDDRQPADLLDQGSVDHMVRVAIAGGVPPLDALRMASLNTAEYFRLRHLGALAPGYQADIMVFSDLKAPRAESLWVKGRLVLQEGALRGLEVASAPPLLPPTINVAWEGLSLRIPNQAGQVRVIGSVEGQLVTEHRLEMPKVVAGEVVADLERDLLKMAVIERHQATGKVGLGLIHGFGLKRGALAGTVAHDHHNLVVVGVDDAEMLFAARAVAEMGGGLVVVEGGRVLAALPLPIAGLMSDAPIEEVRRQLDALLAASRLLGTEMHDPFMAMSFMALEVIPRLKLTDQGLVDVETFQTVGLFVE